MSKMARRLICFVASAVFIMTSMLTSIAVAEEEKRVVEEELVLKDPTVAAAKNWVIGGSYDYWYVGGDYNTYDNTGKTKISEGTIKGDMNGGSIFVGYDLFTLQYTYREGGWDIDSKYLNQPINTRARQEQTESEIVARFLLHKGEYISPYLIVGYNDIKLNVTDKIVTPGWVWTYNNKNTYAAETTFKSGLVGVGMIVPFSKALGIRVDGRLMSTSAEKVRDDGRKWTGSGIGTGGTLTGYWNIFKGVNLQAGVKGQWLNGGDAGGYGKWGSFASLGYSYKF